MKKPPHKLSRKLRVQHHNWAHKDGGIEPAIQIYCGSGFLVMSYDIARQAVDAVHDLCDAHEAEQRKQA